MPKHCCFVTGATGLVGREVVARLLASPEVERVYVLARGFAGLEWLVWIGAIMALVATFSVMVRRTIDMAREKQPA